MLWVIWISRSITVHFVKLLKQNFPQKLKIIWRQFTSLGSFSTLVKFVKRHWKEGMLWTFTSQPCIPKRIEIFNSPNECLDFRILTKINIVVLPTLLSFNYANWRQNSLNKCWRIYSNLSYFSRICCENSWRSLEFCFISREWWFPVLNLWKSFRNQKRDTMSCGINSL